MSVIGVLTMPLPPSRWGLATAAVLAFGAPAAAQVIERNLPPASRAAPTAPVAPPPATPGGDPTPIGPPLTAIVALGATDAVRTGAAPGLDLHAVTQLDTPRAVRALRPFLGQRLSRKLIGDVQVAITRLYRRQGYPLVSVLVPEQEVTSGTLQLRVIAFRVGAVRVTGGRRTSPEYVTRRVRLAPGAPVDADALAQDLDWLNRNPFRQIGVAFSPGAGLGLTDVALTVSESRPWRVYGGAATSGSSSTGRARLFAGVQAAGLPGFTDALVSYQFTASPDVTHVTHPDYASHAVRLTLPVAPRRVIEATYDHVETSQPVRDFIVRQRIDEAALGVRFALPDLLPALRSSVLSDVVAGVEARRARRTLLFGGVDVSAASVDVVQLYAGIVASEADRLGRTALTVTLHASPGGIGRRNGDAAFVAFAGRDDASSHYTYVNGQLSRSLRLGKAFALTGELFFQYAGRVLPQTETTAAGGPSAVRGYALDDGGFDSAVVTRTTLLLPGTPLLGRAAGGDALQPRLFLDAGYGRGRGADRGVTAVSTGIGADYRLGTAVQLGTDAGCPLKSAPFTRAFHCRFEARVTVGL